MESEFLLALEALQKEPTYSNYSALANQHESFVGGDKANELSPVKVALLRNFTIEPLLPVLNGEFILSGFSPDLFLGDFDTVIPDVLNSESPLYQHQADIIIIAQWLETLSSALTTSFLSFSPDQIEAEIDRIVQAMKLIFNGLREQTSAPVLINNFPLPEIPSLGILDAQSEQYQTHSILLLNARLLEASKAFKDIYWVDVFGLFSRIGRDQAFDGRYWQIARAPLGKKLLLPLGQEYGKFVRALRGKVRKCLVLDCDNTLWGGVIGEDGLSGIKLGANYPGSCFQTLQQEILNLYHRGVILALCSKNNEIDVLEVLRDHPEMLLKEKHFATWQINWDDKSCNLERIAEDLNIGIDSLVFVDDSEFECDWVRKQLPEVSVLHLKGDPSTFRSKLSTPGYFDALAYSVEDKERTKMYVGEKKRKTMRDSASSLEEYLADLQIKTEVGIPQPVDIPRVSQLTQKTNQFNLTTQRYTEGDVQHFIEDLNAAIFYIKMSDRISNLGIIGVIILKFSGKYAEIDSLLISCRALGRGVEKTLLNYVVEYASSRNCTHILGRYIQTKKNAQVANFYANHGFEKVKKGNDKAEWIFPLLSD